MTTIRCPHGCSWISQRGSITYEFSDVKIFSGVCYHSDRCEIRDCEYFDDTQKGTRQFVEGMHDARSSIEGLNADKKFEAVMRAIEKENLLFSDLTC